MLGRPGKGRLPIDPQAHFVGRDAAAGVPDRDRHRRGAAGFEAGLQDLERVLIVALTDLDAEHGGVRGISSASTSTSIAKTNANA